MGDALVSGLAKPGFWTGPLIWTGYRGTALYPECPLGNARASELGHLCDTTSVEP